MKTFLAILLPFAVVAAGADVLPWQPYDLTFRASQEHDWWEFPVRAEFSCVGDPASALTVEGFWDGENKWVVRTALPKAGVWTWKTTSADPGLDGKRGSVEVSAAKAEQLAANPNLRGLLRFTSNSRYFEYADGTPFLMLGSTLWAGNTARCGLGENREGPFFQHLADRKAKGFNTILMQYFHGYGDYPESPGHRNEGGKLYHDVESKTLNPLFFKFLDTRMQVIWEEGFAMAIPATWWGKTKNCVFSPEDAQRMSAYCAVRYGPFNSIWCLSGEYQYAFKDCGWTHDVFTALGEIVQNHNPFNRPLSIHPSGQTRWDPPHHVQSSLPFHGESWLDHHWLQTGQGRDRLYNIVTRMEENRSLSPASPVFCSEAFYERPADPEGAYTTRWQVWTAILNGSAGFGYGAFGLWQFYDPNDPAEETGKFSGREVPWWEALRFEGSAQIGYFSRTFSDLDWWTLSPARDRVRFGGKPNPYPTSEDLSPPQAAVLGDQTWILYLPRGNEGKAVEVPVADDTSKWSARWIDPRSGAEFAAARVEQVNGYLALPERPLPSEEDWVCLVKRSP